MSYSEAIKLMPLFAGGLWALLKFREYLKDRRFEVYHDLINQLVNEHLSPDKVLKLDRQIAVVFELRNFVRYYPVTRRILVDLKKQWEEHPRIVNEIDLTLYFISKTTLARLLYKFLKL